MATSRTTTTIKAASTRNLTTIALFKSMIGKVETNSDEYLNWAVRAASAALDGACRRVFARESLLDFFRADSCIAALVLSRPPITNIWAIIDPIFSAVALASAMDASQTTLPATVALTGSFPFKAVLDAGASVEVVRVLSLQSGTTYNVARGVNGNAVAHASGAACTVAMDPALYEIDAAAGIVRKIDGALSEGATSVLYTGGYLLPGDTNRDLPWELEDAALRYMRYMWFSRERDPALRSAGEPGLSNQTWWIGPPGESSNLPPDVEAILVPYRLPLTY